MQKSVLHASLSKTLTPVCMPTECSVLQLYCKHQPKLRKKAAVLARDIAAVCIGLRTAVMIDYMPLTASAMLAILAVAETQAGILQQCLCKLSQPIVTQEFQ